MSSAQKREWWQRNLDRYFYMLEGKHVRTRDPIELQHEITDGVIKLRNETDAFTEKFQQDVDSYVAKLRNSVNESSPLWTPLPTWMSWKKKKRPVVRLEKDRKIIDGRIVRGGLMPGGGRVHMAIEEKLAKIEEKRNMNGARATQIPNRETRLVRKGSKTEAEGWVPKVAGRLGITRPANREAFLGGWKIVGRRLGRVRLGGEGITV